MVRYSRTSRRQTELLLGLDKNVATLVQEQGKVVSSSLVLNTQVERIREDIHSSIQSLGLAITGPIVKAMQSTIEDALRASGQPRTAQELLKEPSDLDKDDKGSSFTSSQKGCPVPRRTSNELRTFEHRRYDAYFGYFHISQQVRSPRQGRGPRHASSYDSGHAAPRLDIQISFVPSIFFRNGFATRLWRNVSGGCDLRQSLTVTPVLRSDNSVFPYMRMGLKTRVMELLREGKISVNAVGTDGFSLVALVSHRTPLA